MFDKIDLRAYTPIMDNSQENTLDSQARQIAMNCACFKLRKASRAITQYYDAALEECGLKVTQLTLLVSLSIAGPVSVSTLAEELVMDRTTLTRNVDVLVKNGLAEVEQGKDKRVKLLKVTQSGRDILLKAFPLWEEAQNSLLARLGKQNWSELSKKLAAVTTLASIQ
ncbi:winged helix-turn-helix transcriptional regulator [Candidatus Obscuribacterales bacterium]|nr:winged helix-turn-helix transcriptional regulator [Candidatus Obscuribacterales bacterium]